MNRAGHSRMFDPKRSLSKHFRLGEFTKSATADKHLLYNMPREESELANLCALSDQVLEPARTILGVPLVITSGYRCATLNRLIGGAAQSQHMLGEAADFIPRGLGVEDAAFLLAAQSDLPFDQMIFETREREAAAPVRWIHISHKRLGGNRRELLTIHHSSNGTEVVAGLQGNSCIITEANQNAE